MLEERCLKQCFDYATIVSSNTVGSFPTATKELFYRRNQGYPADSLVAHRFGYSKSDPW